MSILPPCPYCKKEKWKFAQFGIKTNYFVCENCWCCSPPKTTKKQATEALLKLTPQLKCFVVFPCDEPIDCGCLLAWAEDRDKARSLAHYEGPWSDIEFTAWNARRVKHLDYLGRKKIFPFIIETNDELPKGVTFFLEDIL